MEHGRDRLTLTSDCLTDRKPNIKSDSSSCCYRPQRSCGKVMFLHLSVILFTGGGEFLSGRPPLDRDPPRQRPPAPRTVTSGRYASYWNAFLFTSVIKGTKINKQENSVSYFGKHFRQCFSVKFWTPIIYKKIPHFSPTQNWSFTKGPDIKIKPRTCT